MTLSVAQVEEEVARRITALDATDYNQGGVSAAWTQGERFGLREDGTSGLAHLLFHVFVESSPNDYSDEGQSYRCARLRSRLTVAFTYRLQVSAQIADSRLARDAAADVVRAINADWPEADAILVDAGQTVITEDGAHLGVLITFDILHEIEV